MDEVQLREHARSQVKPGNEGAGVPGR